MALERSLFQSVHRTEFALFTREISESHNSFVREVITEEQKTMNGVSFQHK